MEFIINTTKGTTSRASFWLLISLRDFPLAPADFCESTLKALAMPKAETKADIRNYELMVSELSSTYRNVFFFLLISTDSIFFFPLHS